MIRLAKALSAWGTADFNNVLKEELEQLDSEQLPLQQGLSFGNYATDSRRDVMVMTVSERDGMISAKAGIFYSGIVSGCSCEDDPTPVEEHSEYCEVQVDIDKTTAEAKVELLSE